MGVLGLLLAGFGTRAWAKTAVAPPPQIELIMRVRRADGSGYDEYPFIPARRIEGGRLGAEEIRSAVFGVRRDEIL